jgi:hypothetical protein
VLGLDKAAGGDEVFRHLVLARIIEPVSVGFPGGWAWAGNRPALPHPLAAIMLKRSA